MRSKTARIFNNGGSQAVRLPAEFRFDTKEVFVRRDERTGDVILSKKPGFSNWAEFFAPFGPPGEVPDEFMADRSLNVLPVDKNLFGKKK